MTRRKAKVTASAGVSTSDRYVELARAKWIPYCISAQLEIDAGATQEAALAKHDGCRGAYVVRTQKLLPDPEGRKDPETGNVRNVTQWVEEVRRCPAPWHSGEEAPYDGAVEIEASRKARALELGVPVRDERAGTTTQCRNGHDMTGVMPSGKPVRHVTDRGEVCRMCKAEAAARSRAKREAAA